MVGGGTSEIVDLVTTSRDLEDEILKAATLDHMTGLLGSNYIHQRMNSWYQESKDGLAILMWDIDRFKEVNSKVGYSYGDRVLSLIARTTKTRLEESLNGHKYLHLEIGRYGGEEFIAGLLHFKTDEKHLMEIGDYVRKGVDKLVLSKDPSVPDDVKKRTITIAGKIYETEDGSIFDLIKRHVGENLRIAKEANRRNSITIIPRGYFEAP